MLIIAIMFILICISSIIVTVVIIILLAILLLLLYPFKVEPDKCPTSFFSICNWSKAYINELNLFSDASALDWELPGTLNYYTAQWMMRADASGTGIRTWP